MRHLGKNLMVLVVLSASAISACGATPEWTSCQDELDHLKTASADASEAAEKVKSSESDLDDCKHDPQTYDYLGDHCRTRDSDYESAVTNFESEMDDLDSRLQSVQSECNFDFTINRMSAMQAASSRVERASSRLCASYKRLMPLLTQENVLQVCRKDRDEKWCKSCLGMP